MKKTLWSIMALFAVGIAGYAITLLLPPNLAEHPFLGHHFRERPFALFGHIGLGAVAMLLGPFQFLSGI